MNTKCNPRDIFGKLSQIGKKCEEGNSTVEHGAASFVGEEATMDACGPTMPKDKDSAIEDLRTIIENKRQWIWTKKHILNLEEKHVRDAEDYLQYYVGKGLNLSGQCDKFKTELKALKKRLENGEDALKAEKASLVKQQSINLSLLYSQDKGMQNMYENIEYQKCCIKTEKEKLTIEEERLRNMDICIQLCQDKNMNPFEMKWAKAIKEGCTDLEKKKKVENAFKTEKENLEKHTSDMLSMLKQNSKTLPLLSLQTEGNAAEGSADSSQGNAAEGSADSSQEKEYLPPVIFQGYSNSNTIMHKDFGEFFSKHDQELKKMRIRPLNVLFVYFCTRLESDIDKAIESKNEKFDLLVVMQEERMKQDISAALSHGSLKAITLLYSNDKILDNEDNIRAIKEASSYFQSHHHNFKSEQ